MQLSKWLVGVLGLLLLTGCASMSTSTSPLKGVTDYTLPTHDLQLIHRQGRLLISDKNLLTYVNDILKRLEQAHGEPCNCQVMVDTSSGYEGYAVSSQTIVLSAGLIAQADTEDELAAVIAHELSHALSGDTTKSAFQEALMFTARAGSIAAGSGYGILFGDSLQKSARGLVFRHWEGSQEIEADEFAVNLLAKAGYSQQGTQMFIRRAGVYSDSALEQQKATASNNKKQCVTNKGKNYTINYTQCADSLAILIGGNESIYLSAKERETALAKLRSELDAEDRRRRPQAGKIPHFKTVDYLYNLNALATNRATELKRALQKIESKPIPAALQRNAYVYNQLAVAHGQLKNNSKMQHYFQQAIESDYRTSFNYQYLLSFANKKNNKKLVNQLIGAMHDDLGLSSEMLPYEYYLARRHKLQFREAYALSRCVLNVAKNVDLYNACVEMGKSADKNAIVDL